MKNERCLIKNIFSLSEKIVKICLIVIGLTFTMGFYYDNNMYPDLEEITIELGDILPTDSMVYLNTLLQEDSLRIEDSVPKDEDGHAIKAGIFNYYIVYVDKERKYSKLTNQKSTITVLDTTKPEIHIKKTELTFDYGSNISVNEIAECRDLAKCELSFKEKIDSKKSGTHEVTIIAKDENGNHEEINIEIKIKEKPVVVYWYKTYDNSTINVKNNILNANLSNEEKEHLRYQIIEYAKLFVGNPYVYGGTSLTSGVDCSGFTQAIYSNFGYSLPRVARSQAYVGKPVSQNELLPGDIIVYHYSNGGGHVGIYLGGNKMVHAGTEQTGITISNIFSGNRTYSRIIY